MFKLDMRQYFVRDFVRVDSQICFASQIRTPGGINGQMASTILYAQLQCTRLNA